jgi:hypothetical protein
MAVFLTPKTGKSDFRRGARMIRRMTRRCRSLLLEVGLLAAIYVSLWLANAVIRILFS